MVGKKVVFMWLLVAASFLSCLALTPQILLQSRQNAEHVHELRLAKSLQQNKNISQECTRALVRLETSNNTAAKKYVDAMGKPGAGIRIGNLLWLGSYSECKSIPGASYCVANIGQKPKNGSSGQPAGNPLVPTGFKLGVCVPVECSETDIAIGLEQILKIMGLASAMTLLPDAMTEGMFKLTKTVNCAKPSEYTAGVIATLTLCGILLFLCLVGTIIELVSTYINTSISKKDGYVPSTNEPEEQDTFAVKREEEKGIKYCDQGNPNPVYQPNDSSFVIKLFLCFSLIRNTSHIMNTKVPPKAITSINGMRVLSIWWVILGHTFLWQLVGGLVSNIGLEFTIMQRFTFQGIMNATLAVDSFFFLSGLLVAYLAFRQMDKTKGSLNLFKFYFHRVWRLTPAYMFVLLFYDQLLGFLGEGPLWYQLQSKQPCDKYWWTNLLYINNFYPTNLGETCMTWSWYLANDMQFYVISPVIIFAAYRFGKKGLSLIVGILLLACFISTAVITDHYNLGATILNANGANGQSYVYIKPYCRIAPYLVGMVLGYVFHVIQDKSSRSPRWWFLLCGWCVAIVLALAPLYGTYKTMKKNPEPFTKTEDITYSTFSRCSWAMALAWVVYACHTGYGGLVDKILSARFWIPLSRLTYCLYLVHVIVLEAYFGSYLTVTFYSDVNVAWHFIACTTVSLFVAFIVSVTCEVPMMQLEKIMFKTDRKRD